jgi:hypothetical protein
MNADDHSNLAIENVKDSGVCGAPCKYHFIHQKLAKLLMLLLPCLF